MIEGMKDNVNQPKANVAVSNEPATEPISSSQRFITEELDNAVLHTIEELEENDSDFHLYNNSTEVEESALYLMFVSLLMPVALASITSQFNSILDSGYTAHSVKNKHFFWTYHP